MENKTVAVLFGGVSSEHEVSRVSAAAVARAIPADRFDTVLVGITKDGRWLLYSGSPDAMEDGSWEQHPDNRPAFVSPDRSVHGLVVLGRDGYETVHLDVAFPVLHGKNGEDGTMQGLFELAGIPYVGCPVLGSAVCMDKAVTNSLLDHFGIPQADWDQMTVYEMDDFDTVADRFEARLGYPMFVKPANAGSSVGVSKAKNRAALREALLLAFRHDTKVVVERTVVGKELECSVLGNRELVASVVGEVVSANEFYDYEAKYQSADSETRIPADITPEQQAEIQRLAKRAFRVLGCAGLARVDFFLEDGTGSILLNEPNTIPGFTSISMYAKMLDASGIPFGELVGRLLDLACERMEA